MTIAFLQIIGGLVLLFFGGEALVKGAVAVARHLGIPALVIGLTVVALGTSAPEIVVSIQAALGGHPDIAVGNIIGSNIANILLVLGISAFIAPVAINRTIVQRDNPMLLLLTLLAITLLWMEQFTRLYGIILLSMMVVYVWLALYHAYRSKKKSMEVELPPDISNQTAFIHIILGMAALAFGADILVEGAVSIATFIGISEAMIGVTIVAIGSSAPEIATCAIAAWRSHSDIAAGNVVGSNLFNLFAGLSTAAVISPFTVNPKFLQLDMWVMLAVTLLFFLIAWKQKNFSRLTGGLFICGYVVYIVSQF